MQLSRYDNAGFDPGAGSLKQALWYVCNALVFDSWLLPFSSPKRGLLRCFGARVGRGVVIKPRVNVKYPWKLSVGDHAWIGEGAWVDNLDRVEIGSNVCISQGAYLLTGNHDYRDRAFALKVAGIVIEDEVWIAAKAVVCPGVRVARGTVLTVGSILQKNSEANGVYGGCPATRIRDRYPWCDTASSSLVRLPSASRPDTRAGRG